MKENTKTSVDLFIIPDFNVKRVAKTNVANPDEAKLAAKLICWKLLLWTINEVVKAIPKNIIKIKGVNHGQMIFAYTKISSAPERFNSAKVGYVILLLASSYCSIPPKD